MTIWQRLVAFLDWLLPEYELKCTKCNAPIYPGLEHRGLTGIYCSDECEDMHQTRMGW